MEKHFEDSSSEISYPNGTVYNVDSSGEEKWTHVDGTIIIENKEKGEKKILFANGQKEIHTLEYKVSFI